MVSLNAIVLSLALVGGGGGANQTVLLDFSSESCAPCRSMAPVVQRLENEGYPVQRISVDQQPDLTKEWRVDAIPCFILVQNGREVDRITGRSSYDVLARMYQRAGFRAGQSTVRGQSPDEDSPRDQQWNSAAESQSNFSGKRQMTAAGGPSKGAGAEQIALAASVRIRVKEQNGEAVGSGTIVDVHDDEALVVTCGHLFRDTKGQAPISVELVGARGSEPVEGHLIAYHADDLDIALLAIRPGIEITPVHVAQSFEGVAAGAAVFSIGCDHGGDPRVIRSRITAIDKYVGRTNYSQNIEVAGQPADGRSGGGLFNATGELIGVCNAAEPTDDEGFYAGLKTVQWQLDQVGLAHVYKSHGSSGSIASVNTEPNATELVDNNDKGLIRNPARQPGTRPNLLAAIESGAEVICVIRGPGDKESRVLVLDRSSHELLSKYASEVDGPAEELAELPGDRATVRGQDGRY